MRSMFLLLFVGLCLMASAQSQRLYHLGLPVLPSVSDTLRFSVGDYRGAWIASPSVPFDTLRFSSLRPLQVKFRAENDSLRYALGPGKAVHFLIRTPAGYARTVVHNRAVLSRLRHDAARSSDSLRFLFDRHPDSVAYFRQLRTRYPIDSCVRGAKDDAERVLRVMHWVHGQWKHNGGQAPQKGDALSILEEAKSGKGFPCFAYAEVLRAALNSVGIPTRRVALKTKDVETDPQASGHVANEAYLRDRRQWVFVDPQEDVMPWLKGRPLNAIEFQQAVTQRKSVVLRSHSTIDREAYLNFIYPYLFYIDAGFDQRYGVQQKKRIEGKAALMLVPRGAKNPTRAGFYNNQAIDYCIYTNNRRAFYTPPSY